MEFIKDQHYSIEIEFAVIGICLLEKNAFGRTIGIIKAEMLYDDGNRTVYQTMEKMYAASLPIELLTVNDYIQNKLKITQINSDNVPFYLTRMTNAVVSSANIEYHCAIIKRMWMERQVIKLTNGWLKLEGDVTNQIIQLQTAIRDINSGDYVKDWFDSSELMIGLFKHQENAEKNPDSVLKTGIPELDRRSLGFYPGNLIIMGARPGSGKSALMAQIALYMAKEKKRVGIISLEMNNNEIAARLSSLDTGIPFGNIFTSLFADENEKQKFYDQVTGFTSELPIYISDATTVNMIDIRAKADKLKAKHGLDILFIDYLQLISADQPRNKIREQVIAEISRSCKLMAKELNIPIVLLCQLNRESTKRTGEHRYPQLSDLRESGAIEQDADVVLFIHRDWLTGITQDAQGNSTENKADLIVRKWRNGESNIIVHMDFDGPTMSFNSKQSKTIKAWNQPQSNADDKDEMPF
jgi:replicative DNA helicase